MRRDRFQERYAGGCRACEEGPDIGQEGEAYAQQHRFRYMETSALLNEGIVEVFRDLAVMVKELPPGAMGAYGGGDGNMLLEGGVEPESDGCRC